MKSERLKKLESELNDLEQWMKLGLVPKREVDRHQEEISQLKLKITEEKERLQLLKENGEVEEYITPRRSPAKTVYPEGPSISDMDFHEPTETELDLDPGESTEIEIGSDDEREDHGSDSDSNDYDDEDPFSDRNRWRRGGIMDPDANEW